MNDKFLVGKTIKNIMLAEDKMAILFICEDGRHIAMADADCCSSTWIESVEVNLLRLPCKVLSVKKLDMPEPHEDAEFACLQFYGLRIVTDAGAIEIEYRNESNGYYGGDLSWPGDYFYGGVYRQNVSKQNWQPVDFNFN